MQIYMHVSMYVSYTLYVYINACIEGGYDRVSLVQNGLDEEEVEFKRRVEGDSGLDDDGLDEEYGFSSRDLDRLSMLEKYRNNLIAGASSNYDSQAEEDKSSMDGLRI